jgi:hypothetical protein
VSLSAAEHELVIRVARDETEVTYTGTGGMWVGRLQRLAKQCGCVGEYLSPEVYRVCIPTSQVRPLAAKKKPRSLTEAQKLALREMSAKSLAKSKPLVNAPQEQGELAT